MIGRTLLHYEILGELGAGGMGIVVLARDRNTGRQVALKLLGSGADNPAARDRLRREAGAAARLSHPGIVTLYALEEADGELFLVQELVRGETLSARLARGPLAPADILRLARELIAALAHAHAHGVVHRDLKPDNILVTPDDGCKIADFGIARVEGTPTTTLESTLACTLPYAAPERLKGERGDARGDLFSLGAILHEAMTGERAFPGRTEAEVCYAILNVEPRAIETPQPEIAPLTRLVEHLLAKDPELRPANAGALSAILEGEATIPHPRRRAGRRWIVTAPIVVVLLAGLALVWSCWDREPPPGSLVVLPFEYVPDPHDPGRLGAIVADLLTSSLGQTHAVSVVGTGRVLEILHELDDPDAGFRRHARTVARRAGANRILTGSILRSHPTPILTAEVSEAGRGRLLYASRTEGLPGQDLYQVVDDLTLDITRALDDLGLRADTVADMPKGSRVLGATRYYVEGLEQLARGELSRASRSFTAALELDPEFEKARYQLAYVQWLKLSQGPREIP